MKDLRVLWFSYCYCRLGGGELAAHFIAREMCRQGAHVRFVSGYATPHLPFVLEDRMSAVWCGRTDADVSAYTVPFPDVGKLAKDFGADLVVVGAGDLAAKWLHHVVNTSPVPVGVYCCGHDETDVLSADATVLFWFTPTQALADRVTHGAPRIVVCPYTRRMEAQGNTSADAQHIGLVNRAKSADLVRGIANANRGRRFLGLQGGWGAQGTDWPGNVECLSQTQNIGEFYSRLRVLLVPWAGETFSLSGVEAQAAGVPIVAIDIPPLREALGVGALFCQPTVESFSAALKKLDDPVLYDKMSELARLNAARHDMAGDVREMLAKIRELLPTWSPAPQNRARPHQEKRRSFAFDLGFKKATQ